MIRILLVFAILALQGCGSSSHVPVEDLGQAGRKSAPVSAQGQATSTYTVVKGDTLFSIALRYDLDYRKLALANGIQPPYIIRPNDIIYLRESDSVSRKLAPSVTTYPVRNPIVEQAPKKAGVGSGIGVKEKTPPSALTTGNDRGVAKVAQPALPVPPVTASTVVGWLWPVEGKVIRQFSPQDALSKGIDIGGSEGAPVKAARQGEVVYAGSGLKGYGNLVIIRHDDVHISAYAHNRAILVREGQQVRQGETIAELGMTGVQSPKLHFEIRENGKPVDPLRLLPARK